MLLKRKNCKLWKFRRAMEKKCHKRRITFLTQRFDRIIKYYGGQDIIYKTLYAAHILFANHFIYSAVSRSFTYQFTLLKTLVLFDWFHICDIRRGRAEGDSFFRYSTSCSSKAYTRGGHLDFFFPFGIEHANHFIEFLQRSMPLKTNTGF